MRDLPETLAGQLFGAVAEEIAERAVDAKEASIESGEAHADRRFVNSQPESLFGFTPSLAGTFGLGRTQLGHTLDRLARFSVIARHGTTVAVRMILGPLSRQQLERLPRYLADAYTR